MDPLLIQQKHTTTTIVELLDKYQHDPYMQAKLHNYVCVQLPTIMENIKKTRDERQQRIADLTVEQDEFMERFLNMHRYFYVSTTEKFVSYDGKKYEITAEDNILHHILTTITSEKQLMEWKQRTKVYIMKRIKDNALLKSVPESETIQRVLDHLYPALFETKQDAKYFLTIIGDGLFRKNGEVVYFIQPRAKAFLREITNSSIYVFGINTTHTFKYKYYDHNYQNCRLVKINDSVETENIWGNILRNVSLDMLCVAAHYSIRYGSADEYIARFSNEPTLETYAFFLRNTSQEQLVCRFIDEYLQVSLNGTTQYMGISPASTPPNASNLLIALSTPSTCIATLPFDGKPETPASQANPRTPTLLRSSGVLATPEITRVGSIGQSTQNVIIRDSTTRQLSFEDKSFMDNSRTPTLLRNAGILTISWKNMHYLWRHFLESQHLPTIIFQQNLKTMLTQKLTDNYKEDADTFIGVSSRFMPAIRAFIYFWETTVSTEESGEYEIDELCMLYKRWLYLREPASNTNQIRNTIFDGKTSYIHSFRNEGKEYGALTEKQMIDLITYYFPTTDIEKDKYVFNIRCSLWDKQMDVQTALMQMKESLRMNMENPEENCLSLSNAQTPIPIYATTVYDAYVWYCKYYSDILTDDLALPITFEDKSYPVIPRTPTLCVAKDSLTPHLGVLTDALTTVLPEKRRAKISGKRPIVSKLYFEKYVNDTIPEYVVDEKYILREWLYTGV
jgi:hypothetical protein